MHINTSSYKQYQPPIITDSTLESNKEAKAGLNGSFEDINKDWVTDPTLYPTMHLEELATQHKLGNDDCDLCPEEPSKRKCSPCMVVILRKLCDNVGFNATNVLNKLRQKHALPSGEGTLYGVDVNTSGIINSFANFVWEPAVVKINALNVVTEVACLVLGMDETVKNPKVCSPRFA
ncbi:hypothetical protein GIB67_034781 [Kingdonia uniflora]|uniref:Uncharacterized protein n=1 Tax=Kingdonia uniflora TaxID=39325 RepID=A0A7J7MDR0_9MAGN|nr:hypothetical protein GIB67_034781 [Kingdonia uniflora]